MVGTASGITFTARDGEIDLAIFQGKTINANFIWGGSTPIDVTGFSAQMQLRASTESTTIIADFTVANGRIVIGGVNGKIDIKMTAADSAALPITSGVYDVELTDATSNVLQPFSGRFSIIAEVTK